MQTVQLKDLLEAGCHFGHRADRWHPKAASFIYQERDGIHIIDLAKTKAGLEAAAQFLYELGEQGKTVMFVGTKRQASSIIRDQAKAAGITYLNKRWVGGFFTNWEQVHKNLENIRRLTEEEQNGGWNKYPKHERVKLGRYLRKLLEIYGGVVELHSVPDALFVVDIKREQVAVAEAKKVHMPVVGIVDTNTDPSPIDYAIPSNDDAVGAIGFLVEFLAKAYAEGKAKSVKEAPSEKKESKKEEKAEKVEVAKETAPSTEEKPKAEEKKPKAKKKTK